MTAARITIDGSAIEVAGRFESEAELDAFVALLWRAWFAARPEDEQAAESAPEPENFYASARPMAELPSSCLHRANTVPAIHESAAQRPDVDASDARGHEAAGEETRRAGDGVDPAAAFAALTPQQRRCVLLQRKLRGVAKVAKEMGMTETAVYQHLKAARDKGVAV